MKGWDYYRGQDGPWQQATRRRRRSTSAASSMTVHLATDDRPRTLCTLRIEPSGAGRAPRRVGRRAAAPTPDHAINRVSLGVEDARRRERRLPGRPLPRPRRALLPRRPPRAAEDYVVGRGQGPRAGREHAAGPEQPAAERPDETYIPIPWFMSPRGFGMLARRRRSAPSSTSATRRPTRGASRRGRRTLDITIFADPDPKNLARGPDERDRPPARDRRLGARAAPPRRHRHGRDGTGCAPRTSRRASSTRPCTTSRTAAATDSRADEGDHGGSPRAGLQGRRVLLPVRRPTAGTPSSTTLVVERLAREAAPTARRTSCSILPYNAGMVDFTNPDAVTWYQAHAAAGARRRVGRLDVRLRRVRPAGRRDVSTG